MDLYGRIGSGTVIRLHFLMILSSYQAKKFLESFEADKISHLAPAHYEVFVKSGNYMVKHYKGDVI